MSKLRNKNDFFNRELSWLEFNKRVLEQAEDKDKPALERLKFLAITGSNLDEFFMVRVASVKRQFKGGNYVTDPAGLSPSMQLKEIHSRSKNLVKKLYHLYEDEVLPELDHHGIKIHKKIPDKFKEYTSQYFQNQILPLITPVRFDISEAFINFSNLKLHIAFKLRRNVDIMGESPSTDSEKVAIIRLPAGVPRFVMLPDSQDQVHVSFLEQIITEYAHLIFTGYTVLEHMVFRVTRDADFAVDEKKEEDFKEAMEEVLHNRDRSSIIKLSVSNTSQELRSILQDTLRLEQHEVYVEDGPLEPSNFMDLCGIKGFDHLRFDTQKPVESKFFKADESVFDSIKKHDILLNLPYESFSPVVRLVQEAATDPRVLAIKMTLYRTSGDSPIVQALEDAARNGKHVSVMVEIKARFDEQRNIAWAERLSQAGVIVVYGIVGLKVHAKALLVVRKEESGIKRYLQLSTGNYNDRTARLYTDLALFTCREDFAYEAGLFFNTITGYSAIPVLHKIVMAPNALKSRLLQMIDREIEKGSKENPGKIIAKFNSLVDVDIIEALYKASEAGVEIVLNVRGICVLVPGVPGQSTNIKVFSIIGRYLEHTRAIYFKNGGSEEVWLSSADWMPRNLEGRVEILFPVEDEVLKEQVKSMLQTACEDNVLSYELDSTGRYTKRSGEKRVDSQEMLYKMAQKRNQTKDTTDNKVFAVRKDPPKQ